MSALYRHTCGQPLFGTIRRDGFDYVITFLHAVTEQPIEHCPRCHAELGDALRQGELIDLDLAHQRAPSSQTP